MAEITVVIPAYNQAAYLAEAIQSVYDQTFTNWELFVVDDGSTDDTHQVLANFQDTRIKVIRQVNKGVSAARNTGIFQSSAPFITFLDADDLFMPDKMTVLYEYLKAYPEVGLVVGGLQSIDTSGGKYKEKIITLSSITFPELLHGNDIPLGGVMLRREWLERVGGFDETMHTCEDWDLWLRMVVSGCQLACVENVVLEYRIHSGQVTKNSAMMRIDSLRMWDKFFNLPNLPEDFLAYRPRVVASALVRTSARAFRSGEFELGIGDIVDAIKLDPGLSSDGYKRLINLLIGWANDPQTQDSEAYLLAVYKHVSPILPGLRRPLRKAMAAITLGSLFGASPETWQTRKIALIKAILYDPSWLANRGVLRMIMDAWFKVPSKGES